MFKMVNGKLKIRWGKFVSTAAFVLFVIVGIILLFLDNPGERIAAFKEFLTAVFPYVGIISGGVAVTGAGKEFVKAYIEAKKAGGA
jgi:hypothetical protein